jgi:TatD DNase family protein
LIDIGANLAHDSFNPDFTAVLQRAREASVEQIVVTGSSEDSSTKALELARQHQDILFATAGMHPHHASDLTQSALNTFRQLAAEPEVKAIGETGLDFYRDFSPRDLQEKAFEQHIELAIELAMPLFLHERDAYPRFYEILKDYRSELSGIVVHCFTGEKKALFAYLDLDCHIGVTGWICDERRGTHLLPLVGNIPHDRLMLETDSPYLLPRTVKDKPKKHRNEPCYLDYVCTAVAEASDQTTEAVAAQTTDNAKRFFDLP